MKDPTNTEPTAKDSYFQAHALNAVQGKSFYFGKTSQDDLSFPTEEELTLARLTNPNLKKPFDVEFTDPRVGHPRALAYTIWAGIEKVCSDRGRDFDGVLQFSARSLCKVAGRQWGGGNGAAHVYRAMKQLEAIRVLHWYEAPVTQNKQTADELLFDEFRLFSRQSTVINRDTGRPLFYRIKIDETTLQYMKESFYCMSYSRIAHLDPAVHSVARILYRFLGYRYSKARNKKFEYTKDYGDMCREWFGGINPQKHLSQAKRKHLDSRFAPLKEIGLLSSYVIEKNVAQTGFNVRFRAGKAFFEDYATFYQQPLPFHLLNSDGSAFDTDQNSDLPSNVYVLDDQSSESEAITLLEHFASAWYDLDPGKVEFSPAEVAYATDVVNDVSDNVAFVDFGIAQARSSRFPMKSFNGLKRFRAEWESAQKSKKALAERNQDEALKRHEAQLEEQYETFVTERLEQIRNAMSAAELAALEAECTKQMEMEFPDQNKFLSGFLRSRVNQALQSEHPLPDFETWKTNHAS